MTSYSKIFKAAQVSIVNEVKVIPPSHSSVNLHGVESKTAIMKEQIEVYDDHNHRQLLNEAEAQATAIIAMAKENAMAIEREAQEMVNQWWEENQTKLATLTHEAQQQGYSAGFEKGEIDAKNQIQQDTEEKMQEIQHLLEQAYEQKAAIIAEAEPFLLELSTAIASQIIKQELDQNPERFVELIKQHMVRVKEKEFITICVHPGDFEFIQAQRAQLASIANGETEITILPDHNITPKGCIIRTAFGSVDARIETQLEEIKKVILAAGRVLESEIIS
jgi:flagellar assembly protein FliH